MSQPDHEIDQWVKELDAAGWVQVRLNVWRSPDGELYRGPFGAWRKMRAMACNSRQ